MESKLLLQRISPLGSLIMGTSTQSWVWHCLTKIQTKNWNSALPGCAEAAASRNEFVQQLCSREPAEQQHTEPHRRATGTWHRQPSCPRHISHKAAELFQSIWHSNLTASRTDSHTLVMGVAALSICTAAMVNWSCGGTEQTAKKSTLKNRNFSRTLIWIH